MLAAAELDMQWHTLPAERRLQNPDEFEQQALAKTHLDLRAVPPRYRSSYFSHIWGGGYSAGYYAYYGPNAGRRRLSSGSRSTAA